MSFRIYNFLVSSSQDGERLDLFLSTMVSASLGLSRTRLARLIDSGSVLVDEERPSSRSFSLRVGQCVRLTLPRAFSAPPPPPASSFVSTSSPPLEVLFEDEHLLCFVKPSGIVTHPALSVRGETLVDRLYAHCGSALAGYPEDSRCGIVHRLDKYTSGVMLGAKTDEARLKLSSMFARHSLSRIYVALAWGVPSVSSGCISAPLARHPIKRTQRAVCRDTKRQGKSRRAVTHYRTLCRFSSFASLLSCELETGRTHQIRVHLSSIGHHVIGDSLYKHPRPRVFFGEDSEKTHIDFTELESSIRKSVPLFFGERAYGLHSSRHALHALSIGFEHPITGESLFFSSPPPRDFQALQEHLSFLTKQPEFTIEQHERP